MLETTHFLKNCGQGFAQRLLPQLYITFKRITQKIFELEHEHCKLTENPLRRLVPFHWYCNFNGHTSSNDV